MYIQNLQILVTKKCNLNCMHCMRGKQLGSVISNEVIDKSLSEISAIGTLSIGGGEPTLAIERIEYIFNKILENKVQIDEYGLVTNGTVYSEELLKLFEYFEKYVELTSRDECRPHGEIYISLDTYHIEELKRLGKLDEVIENIKKYSESKFFSTIKTIDSKLFREGNATSLPKKLSVPFRPMKMLVTYANNDEKLDIENGFCNIGPLVTINPDGVLTEDVSWESQATTYNYGNVLDNSIEDICRNRCVKILTPKKWYEASGKEIQKYHDYKH